MGEPTWGAMRTWARRDEADAAEAELRTAKARHERQSLGRNSGGGSGGSSFAEGIVNRFDAHGDARKAMELRDEEATRTSERALSQRKREFDDRQNAMELASMRQEDRHKKGRDEMLSRAVAFG